MKKKKRIRLATMGAVDEALYKAAIVLEIRSGDVRKHPQDAEALHQYRISVRVARSLVRFLTPYLDAKQGKRLKVALKQLQDPTSRMRELDVLADRLPDESPCKPAVLEAQAWERAEFNGTFREQATQDLLEEVEYLLKCGSWSKEVDKQGIDPVKLRSRVEASRTEIERSLATIEFDNQEAVHDLRKQAKRLRYVSRELAAVLPHDAGATSARMQEVQDLLGDWCDARVNAALVTEICGAAGAELAASYQEVAEAIIEELRAEQG